MNKHFNDLEQAHILYRQITMMASDAVYKEMETKFMSAMVIIEN